MAGAHDAPPVTRALAEHTGASGRQFLDALVLGIDVACRVGKAIYPDRRSRSRRRAVSPGPSPRSTTGAEITSGLGTRFEIALNTYKPFACGVVIHPSIDGCVQIAREHALRAADVERVTLRVHPLVLELTGKKTPRTGLEGKLSVYHACAAGIIFGQAGESEFSDAVVARPDLVALRERVEAIVDPAIAEDAADVTIVRRDGRVLHVAVADAIGSLEHPMSDVDLARKFHGLVDPILGSERADRLIERCTSLAERADLRSLAALARP